MGAPYPSRLRARVRTAPDLAFVEDGQQRNVVLIGGTRTSKTRRAVGIARAFIRDGDRGRFFNAVDLVNKLDIEARDDR